MSCFSKIPGRIDSNLNQGNNSGDGDGDDGTNMRVVRST